MGTVRETVLKLLRIQHLQIKYQRGEKPNEPCESDLNQHIAAI